MDGYASVGAAMIWENMKATFTCHVPEAIIGDVDVLKNAPMDMIRAGYGDILGKYSCLNDWKLSHIVNGEYFCQYVHDLMMDMVVKTQDLGEKLQNRDPEAIQTLMEALAGAGVAMALVGNSRPASGSEHHMSHYFEITGIVRDEPYLMHGTDVLYSAVYTQMLREKLLQYQEIPAARQFHRETWEENIRRIYGNAAEGVIALQDKMGWYGQNRYDTYAAKWNEIQGVLSQAPSAKKMEEYIQRVGLSLTEYTDLYGNKKIDDGIAYAKDLKDRYSVLWLYHDLILK
jgi:glycerol-1-phosphate dehydrogenase [NAD(P)+]